MSAELSPGGRLVEQKNAAQRLAVVGRRQRLEVGEQKARELQALRLAARERRGRLPEAQVAKPDRTQRLEPARHGRRLAEKAARLVDRQCEHFVDVAALEADGEDVALEAAAVARVALHLEVGHEMHLDRHGAGAVAFLAASAIDVEGKVARLHAEAARLVLCANSLRMSS